MGTNIVCARCGQPFDGYPAISRLDNKTAICSECGTLEALEQLQFGHVPNWLDTKEDEDVQS